MNSCRSVLQHSRPKKASVFSFKSSVSSSGLNCIGQLSARRQIKTISASELRFGQPVHETHPHVLKAGELTPGITAAEYSQRRSKLASRLPKNAVAIVAASDVKFRSGAVFYDFHQNSDFFYLSGFNEPEAVAVIGKATDDSDHIFHLLVRPKDAKAEQWDGARSGFLAAIDIFNADETGDINRVEEYLSPIVNAASEVYTDLPTKPTSTTSFSRFFSNPPLQLGTLAKVLERCTVKPMRSIINDLRVFKSDAEVLNMRKAGQISGRVFTEAMRQTWTREKDLAAFLDYRFKARGCDSPAYIPVVGGGLNGNVIHYVRNDDVLRNGELVLVDAGGDQASILDAKAFYKQFGNYITDIARSWPISGIFTAAQKDLYTAVLSTQRSCIALCRASASISLDKLHEIAESLLKDQLTQLGFDMSGKALETLFPHHLSHYIGLDVHDTPGQSRKNPLKAGQCVTVEPGLYIPDTDQWPAHFRGLNIRIEDSICVQEEHPFVLTTEAVKEVEDIEALRA